MAAHRATAQRTPRSDSATRYSSSTRIHCRHGAATRSARSSKAPRCARECSRAPELPRGMRRSTRLRHRSMRAPRAHRALRANDMDRARASRDSRQRHHRGAPADSGGRGQRRYPKRSSNPGFSASVRQMLLTAGPITCRHERAHNPFSGGRGGPSTRGSGRSAKQLPASRPQFGRRSRPWDRLSIPSASARFTPNCARRCPPMGSHERSMSPTGTDPREMLDVYEPSAPAATPAPVLIFVHGGAFVGGDKKNYDNIGYYFARHGVVAVLPNYRLAPANPWPAGVQDVAVAVKWTLAHIATHGGDPRKIVLFGHSAGATHVAAYALEKTLPTRDRLGPRRRGTGLGDLRSIARHVARRCATERAGRRLLRSRSRDVSGEVDGAPSRCAQAARHDVRGRTRSVADVGCERKPLHATLPSRPRVPGHGPLLERRSSLRSGRNQHGR